ncbi:MAG: hypothetical protein ACTHMI_22125 [Mucilaginibacter sp.]
MTLRPKRKGFSCSAGQVENVHNNQTSSPSVKQAAAFNLLKAVCRPKQSL